MKAKEVMEVLNICRRILASNWFNSNNFISDNYKIKIKINNKISTDFIV